MRFELPGDLAAEVRRLAKSEGVSFEAFIGRLLLKGINAETAQRSKPKLEEVVSYQTIATNDEHTIAVDSKRRFYLKKWSEGAGKAPFREVKESVAILGWLRNASPDARWLKMLGDFVREWAKKGGR